MTAKVHGFDLAEFDVDLEGRKVIHSPSGICFSFYQYHNEEDWKKSDVTTYRNNPEWLGDRNQLAAAAKEAAIARGMSAAKREQ